LQKSSKYIEMKAKSKFLDLLERVVKEDDATGTITTDPATATQASDQATAAQATSGQKNADAIKAANTALLAAIKAHPELNGDVTKLSDPNFIKNLTTTTT